MMRSLIKWICNLLIILLAALIFFSMLLTYKVSTNPDQISSIFSFYPMTVLSGSMNPLLKPGDMIIVRSVDPREVKIGDIITFKTGQQTLVTHRVTEILEQEGALSFRTKGDANNIQDSQAVLSNALVGSYVLKIPFGGYAARYIRTPQGFAVFILIPIILLIGGEIKTILSETAREKRKENGLKDGMETKI